MNINFTELPCRVINLKHRLDRKQEFLRNLDFNNISLSNLVFVDAVLDKGFGGLGCAKSHVLALTDFLCRDNSEYLVMLEDDFDFSCSHDELNNRFNQFQNQIKNWDVFILSGHAGITAEEYPNGFAKVFESQTTSGYVIRRGYIEKLVSLFIECIYGMEKYYDLHPRQLIYNRFAIDQHWKSLQRLDQWFTTKPYLGHQRESYSDIESQVVNYQK